MSGSPETEKLILRPRRRKSSQLLSKALSWNLEKNVKIGSSRLAFSNYQNYNERNKRNNLFFIQNLSENKK